MHADELPVMILYFPARHAAHAPPFGPVYPRLQRQAVEILLPTEDTEFDGQFAQVEDAVAPITVEYVLTLQLMHVVATEAPTVVEYLPASQFTQELATVAPVVVRYLPALQSVHPALPVTILYFPAAQAEHVPPFGPVNPRLQTQLLNAVEPLTDCELLGQSLQVLLAEAPTVEEYVFTPQFKQVLAVVAPVVVEYFPASQLLQMVDPAVDWYVPAAQLEQVPTVVAPTTAENVPA
jgi:hypothetical protein